MAPEPRLCYCPRCGGPAEGVVLGPLSKLTHIDTRKVAYAPKGKESSARAKLGWHCSDVTVTEPAPNDRIPAPSPCRDCLTEIAVHRATVEAGGIYWRCAECGHEGVIQSGVYAASIRADLNVQAPKPCGVEFTCCADHKTKERT